MKPLALVSALPDVWLCSRCRMAPGGRVFHHPLYGRRTYCALCARTAGGEEAALVREMGAMLVEGTSESRLDLMDWHAVREWLLARHWTRAAVAGLADQAIAHAQGELASRRRSRKWLEHAGEAVAALFAACSFAAFACFMPPVAHAAERGAPQSSGFWAEMLPAGALLLIIAGLIVIALRSAPKMTNGGEDAAIGDTTNWSDRS